MAQLDSSIYQMIGRGVKSIPELDNEYAAAKQNKIALALGQANLDDRTRAMEDTRSLNEAYKGATGADGKIDRNSLYTRIAAGGQGSKLPTIQKGFAEQDKEAALQKKAEIESHLKKFEMTGQIMAGVSDQATWEQARQKAAEMFGPEAAAQMPAQYDPALVEQKRKQAMSVKDQLDQDWKRLDHTLKVDQFGETKRHNTTTEGLTAQGHVVSTENNKRSVGASMANANATREAANTNASATRDAAAMRRDQDTEMKLSDDYRAQSKPFKEVSDAFKTITASLDKATTSPAATLAGATKFMKLLDPGSVVRESELGMALAATGVLDRAANYHQTLLRGKVLTPKQAEDFKDIAGQIYKAAQSQQQMIDKDYKGKAETYKLRPDMVVQDLGQNKGAPGKPNKIMEEADAILNGKRGK